MYAELRDGRMQYRLVPRGAAGAPMNAIRPSFDQLGEARRFLEPWEARGFLARFALDPIAQHELRRLLSNLRDQPSIADLSIDALVERLAAEIARGNAAVYERALTVTVGIATEPPAPEEPDLRPPPAVETDHWIKIKVVLDATGEPIPGVELRVRQPDGYERNYDTRADGAVEVKEIDPGACAASGPLNVGAQRVADTWHVVGMGTSPIEPEKGQPIKNPHGGHLAKIDEHKVADGETIDSLARGAGTTWQDLSKFNWGTSTPTEINKHLRDDVGCTKKTADGYNYIFTSNDDPGIMFIPTAWSEEGLATDQEHVIRVRRATAEKLVDWEFSI